MIIFVGYLRYPKPLSHCHIVFSASKLVQLAHSRLLLHFEAVDHSARVWVNGTLVGSHQGGFTPFEFDITEAVTEDLVGVDDDGGRFWIGYHLSFSYEMP